ncbi:brain and acute leukemia cytoplasmic protein isoform X3 [Dromaius novaehollandiae]|uniref:brain and acute leukemia cytoplasmic protein isoform X3 n=1 Tax=Dromaius novaehollandiae TaxID=8790 RepID=UPI00311E669A
MLSFCSPEDCGTLGALLSITWLKSLLPSHAWRTPGQEKKFPSLHSAFSPAGILEEGKSTQTGVTTASTTTGILNTEKRPSCGPQCGNPTVPTTGAVAQRPSSFRTAEFLRWQEFPMDSGNRNVYNHPIML